MKSVLKLRLKIFPQSSVYQRMRLYDKVSHTKLFARLMIFCDVGLDKNTYGPHFHVLKVFDLITHTSTEFFTVAHLAPE